MRRVFADFSPGVAAAFAAGLGISLWIFLLPAGVVQKGPTPVLPGFARAGRVAADLPVAVGLGSKVRKPAVAYPQTLVALRPPTTTPQVPQRARTRVVRAVSSPVRATAPAARRTPVTRSELFSMPPKAKGKALGHARGHGPQSKAATPAPLSPGRGKALGHANKHQDRLPPGLAKKVPAASAPGPPPRPKGNAGGNGGKGNGGKGNGGGNAGKGNGGGNEGKGNGGGNGHKGENE